MAVAPHPAKFSPVILDEMRRWLMQEREIVMVPMKTLVDPFAGLGRIHTLGIDGLETRGLELEPEWARAHPRDLSG